VQRIGPYEILGELGRGGMGVVYHVRRADLDREFALKVISEGALASDPLLLPRFLREGTAAAALAGHPGIVAVHDVGEQDGVPYLAMDFVDGVPLDELLRDDAPPPRACAELIAQVARAVHHAHRAGVFHRDLKPANIIQGADGTPRVADFGLAKLAAAGPELTKLTQSNTVVGTPAYMPPEQATGGVIDARSDVYALGATLYDACAGGPPFDGPSIFQIISKVLREPPPALRRRNPGVAPELAAIVERCLEKDPDRRYRTAEALAEDLEAWLEGRPTVARPVGPLARLARWSRRRAVPLAAGAAVLGALAGGGWWLAGRPATDGGLEATTEKVERLTLAAQLDRAWAELLEATLPDVMALEAHWYGRAGTEAELAERMARIEAAAQAVAARYPDTKLPPAWTEYARFLLADAYHPNRLTAALEDIDPADDPFPLMLLARARLHYYAWKAIDLDVSLVGRRLRLAPFQESEGMKANRVQAEAELARAMQQPVWGELTQGRELRAFTEAAHALASLDWKGATTRFHALRDDPVVGRSAEILYGLTLYHAGDPDGAAEVWTRAGRAGWSDTLVAAGWCRLAAGIEADARTGDPRPHLRAAVALADEALELAPGRYRALMLRGRAQLDIASAAMRAGEDPSAAVAASQADYSTMAEAVGFEQSALNFRALGHHLLAEWAVARGKDPRPHLTAALADYDGALKVVADYGSALVNRSRVHRLLGDLAVASGGDPFPHFQAARRDLSHAADTNLSAAGPALLNRANLTLEESRLRLARGEDARPLVREAMADYEELDRRGLGGPDVVFCRANARMVLADHAKKFGETAGPHYDAAISDYQAAIAAGPPDAEWHATLGAARWERAVWNFAAGRPGKDDLNAALADFDRALKLNPRDLGTFVNRALVHKERVRQGMVADALAGLKLALADFDHALTLSPGHVDTHYNRGVTHGMVGDRVESAGGDPKPHYLAAVADFDAVTAAAPTHARAFAARAAVRINLAVRTENEAGDARALIGQALDDFARAAQLDPNDWVARANRAQLLMMLERWDDAVTELEAALRLQPGHPKLEQLLVRAKHEAGK
jgi:serine/threonine-protein kinase